MKEQVAPKITIISGFFVLNNGLIMQWLYVIGPNITQGNKTAIQTTLPLSMFIWGCACGCNLCEINLNVGLPAAGPSFRFYSLMGNWDAGAYWGFAIFIGY